MRVATAQPAPFTKRGKQAVNIDENFLTIAVQRSLLAAIAAEFVKPETHDTAGFQCAASIE
ncbi:UNVERIFIED_ORG: hypothetical protein GGD48_004310 [Rhizobium etli]